SSGAGWCRSTLSSGPRSSSSEASGCSASSSGRRSGKAGCCTRRSERMAEPDDRREAVRAWWEKGDADLRSARILLEADPPLTDVVCFHSQQAAEKYLKSFLVYHDVEPPYTHSLTTLLSLCV